MLGGSFWTTSRVYMQLRGGGAEGLQIFDKISMQYICYRYGRQKEIEVCWDSLTKV